MKTYPVSTHLNNALASMVKDHLYKHDIDEAHQQLFEFVTDEECPLPKVSDLRLRCSRLCGRSQYSPSSVSCTRHAIKTDMQIYGHRATFMFLRSLRAPEEGFTTFYGYTCEFDRLINCLRNQCGVRKMPFPEDGKGVSGITLETVGVTQGDSSGVEDWTSYGRIIATLNTWLKDMGFDPVFDTAKGNDLLAALQGVIDGCKPEVSWYDGKVSEIYSHNGGAPYPSCMKGADAEWFDLYDYMQGNDQLKVLEVRERDRHIGRALVWLGSNPDDAYIDRIYAPSSPTSSDPRPDVVAAIAAFCEAEDIRKTVFHQTARLIPALELKGQVRINVGRGYNDFEYFPYCDSMKHLSSCGWLSTFGYGNYCAELQQTDGTCSETCGVTLHNGDRVDEDDAVWVDRYDEHYHRDDVTYSDYLGEWVVDDSMVETAEGYIVWDDHDGLVGLRNGDYALSDNVSRLHDDTYVWDDDYRVDLVELHDGEYADRNEDDVVELHDWQWALRGDTVTLHDGAYALDDDDDVVEVDGVYYLSADAPEEDAA